MIFHNDYIDNLCWMIICFFCCCYCYWQTHISRCRENKKSLKFKTHLVNVIKAQTNIQVLGFLFSHQLSFFYIPLPKTISLYCRALGKQLFHMIFYPYLCKNSRQKKQRRSSKGTKYTWGSLFPDVFNWKCVSQKLVFAGL